MTDARTGANLKGAKITIEETGQWTSTNGLGEFRFVNVPTSSATLTVSYLGYAGQSAAIGVSGARVVQDFALRGGSDIEEIVVFGQRSARAIALNQERTANNIQTVISSDLLGTFNGTTISEALRRAPGVAFVPDESTGQGSNIIIRGLQPDLNQVLINGVRLLDGTGEGRSPDLSNLLTENIESVTINKTLLPNQDSNGAGGLVEVETKSPLDRDHRFASFGVEYGERGNSDFGEASQVSGTVSGIFGKGQDLGLSLSVAYRDEKFTRISYSTRPFNFGEFLPDGAASTFSIDPRNRFPFETGAERVFPTSVSARQGVTEHETLSLTLGVAKYVGSHTELRFDYTQNSQDIKTVDLSTFTSVTASYRNVGPIEELGGEERNFFAVENASSSAPGILGRVQRTGSLVDAEETSHVLSFSGVTNRDLWTLSYGAGYSRSEREVLEEYSFDLGFRIRGTNTFRAPIERTDISQDALADTRNGLFVSLFEPIEPGGGRDFLLPRFSDAGFAFYNDVSSQPLRDITQFGVTDRGSEAFSGEVGIRRELDFQHFKYVEAGLSYRDISFWTRPRISTREFETASGVLASDVGIVFGSGLLTTVGAQNDFAALSRENLQAVAANLDSLESRGLLTRDERDRSIDARETGEESFAAYLLGQASFGKFELIGGVRVDRIDIVSTFFDGPRIIDEDGECLVELEASLSTFITESVSQTDVLPRFVLNYRHSENTIVRAGYFTTISRPQVENLTQRRSITLDLERGGSGAIQEPELRIFRGNPDLKPALTHSYDLSLERYWDDIGVLKAGVFYKEIENPIQSNRVFEAENASIPSEVVLPSDPIFQDLPSDLVVSTRQPINSENNNRIWGAELVAERQFTFLPSFWSGFGVYANYTYTDSASTQRLSISRDFVPEGFVEIEEVPFEGSPEHSGTIGLTFSKHDLDASLLYSVQDRRLSSFERFGLHDYNEQIETLDLRIDYLTNIAGSNVRLYLRGTDLLRDEKEPYLETSIGGEDGVPKYFTGGTYFGGRSIFVGVTAVF